MPNRARPAALEQPSGSLGDPFERHTEDPRVLLLDSTNPRLYGLEVYGTSNQDKLLKAMWSFGVADIVDSICAGGYQNVEPLFAEIDSRGKLVVIEGNRRLTALKVLLEPERARGIGIQAVPALPPRFLASCEKVPVAIGDRGDVWTFIATKHLNGPKTWDSVAKAAYIKYVHEKLKRPLAEIALSIGDRNATVERMYQALKVLEQAEGWRVFDRNDHKQRNEFPFSHLYTLIGYENVREYLGVSDNPSSDAPVVPKSKAKLGELLLWTYGSKKKDVEPRVKQQNPDLRKLALAVSNDKGLKALREGYSPAEAAEIAEGDEAIVLRHLSKGRDELQNASKKFSTVYNGQSEIKARLEEVRDITRGLLAQQAAKEKGEL